MSYTGFCPVHIADLTLQISDFTLRIDDFMLHIGDSILQIDDFTLQVSDFTLHIADRTLTFVGWKRRLAEVGPCVGPVTVRGQTLRLVSHSVRGRGGMSIYFLTKRLRRRRWRTGVFAIAFGRTLR